MKIPTELPKLSRPGEIILECAMHVKLAEDTISSTNWAMSEDGTDGAKKLLYDAQGSLEKATESLLALFNAQMLRSDTSVSEAMEQAGLISKNTGA